MARRPISSRNDRRPSVRKISPTWAFALERMTGIEPALSAWEADVLPLNYIRREQGALASEGPDCLPTSYRNGKLPWALLADRRRGSS
jgi:hypothetical protein